MESHDVPGVSPEGQKMKMDAREQALIDAVATPCLVTDLEGRYLFGNGSFFQFVGYEPKFFKTRNCWQVLFGAAPDSALLPPGDGRPQERLLCRTSSGERKMVQVGTKVLCGEDGASRAVMTTLVDLSDLEEALAEVESSRIQKEAILQGFPGIIGYFNKELQAVWMNEGVRRLCADPIGRNCHQIFCHRDTPCPQSCAISQAMETGNVELSVKCSSIPAGDNDDQLYDMTAIPVRSGSGGIDGVLVMAWDVSERHQLEKQLRHSQKMEAIGTLAGGIAHDFNNVLTPIMGYSEIIRLKMRKDGYPDPVIGDYIEEILKAARRAKNLVEQILTFSRSHEKKEQLQYIHPIVKEVMKLMRVTLPATIQINQEIDEQCGLVSVDPVQIHQVLINLCTNSAHAMTGRRGTLTVKLAKAPQDEQGQDWLELSVADTGTGIEPEMLDRIFEPYFTTKEKSRGTGMGLAMVHGIITRQGGKVTVESQVGRGTTFRVFLPISQQVTPLEHIVSAAEIVRGEGRILLVDDEEQVVNVTSQMLVSLGYQVTGRTSAMEAFELFAGAHHDFDLLITDLTMPELTGIELSARFKAIRPGLPVILFTGYSEQFSKEAAVHAGVSRYCTKPFALRELSSLVHQLISRGDAGIRP
ncbi:MAG: response regulator [Desulfobulbaceae bacterium]|nr:MAG: response regulator [Desulfobulbaceae bacterium]